MVVVIYGPDNPSIHFLTAQPSRKPTLYYKHYYKHVDIRKPSSFIQKNLLSVTFSMLALTCLLIALHVDFHFLLTHLHTRSDQHFRSIQRQWLPTAFILDTLCHQPLFSTVQYFFSSHLLPFVIKARLFSKTLMKLLCQCILCVPLYKKNVKVSHEIPVNRDGPGCAVLHFWW